MEAAAGTAAESYQVLYIPEGGEFLKLKSRLVAGGDQKNRTPYEDVSLPTATITVIFIVLIIAAVENRHVASSSGEQTCSQ